MLVLATDTSGNKAASRWPRASRMEPAGCSKSGRRRGNVFCRARAPSCRFAGQATDAASATIAALRRGLGPGSFPVFGLAWRPSRALGEVLGQPIAAVSCARRGRGPWREFTGRVLRPRSTPGAAKSRRRRILGFWGTQRGRSESALLTARKFLGCCRVSAGVKITTRTAALALAAPRRRSVRSKKIERPTTRLHVARLGWKKILAREIVSPAEPGRELYFAVPRRRHLPPEPVVRRTRRDLCFAHSPRHRRRHSRPRWRSSAHRSRDTGPD